jgi:hypothetical protein
MKVFKIGDEVQYTKEIRRWDKKGALESLAKHLGLQAVVALNIACASSTSSLISSVYIFSSIRFFSMKKFYAEYK